MLSSQGRLLLCFSPFEKPSGGTADIMSAVPPPYMIFFALSKKSCRRRLSGYQEEERKKDSLFFSPSPLTSDRR